jgi:uncharacterized protein (TIGR02996 family)
MRRAAKGHVFRRIVLGANPVLTRRDRDFFSEPPPPAEPAPPSPDRLAFLTAICAEPSDYATRQGYARWLQGIGDHEEAEKWRDMRPAFFAGLDLGQSIDFSAIVVLERHAIPNSAKPGRTEFAFDVRHLHRWQLKTPYPKVVEDTKALFASGPLHGSTLAVDETGVGRPVVDMFRAAKIACKLRPYSITCGSAVTSHTVAKKHLVGCIQAPLSSGRLRFASGLALTPVLTKELETFQVTVDESTRNESFAAWRTNAHDDLVLALSLALLVASVPEYYAGVSAMG